MRYETARHLQESDCKRLCGGKQDTCGQMCQVVQAAGETERRGRKPALSVEDQVLLTLTFWREYRTRFPLGQEGGCTSHMFPV